MPLFGDLFVRGAGVVFYAVRAVALTPVLSHREREDIKTVGPVSVAPPGDTASLFQRIRQRLNTQRICIVTHAEHAVGFHVVVHHRLHQQTAIIQLNGG